MILLLEMRKKRNMTQKELATASKIPQQTISTIENGKRKNPGVLTMARLAKVLRCAIEDLCVEDREEGTG